MAVLKNYLFLWVPLVLFPFHCLAETNSEPVLKNTLLNLHVNGLEQDSFGYVWIATSRGLCRYNGYEYLYYYYNPDDPTSLSSDAVYSIFMDSEQQLWFSTEAGVCRFDYAKGSFERYGQPGGEPEVIGFLESGTELLVYGSNGVQKIDRENRTIVSTSESFNLFTSTLQANTRGDLWAGVSGQPASTVYRLGKELQPLEKWDIAGIDEIYDCYRHDDGNLYFGCSNGIVVFDPIRKEFRRDIFPAEAEAVLKTLKVTVIKRLDRHKLFIGTANRGIFIHDLAAGTVYPASREGLFSKVTSRHITACLMDKYRNIWVGTFDNGFTVESTHRTSFNPDRTLSGFMANKFVTSVVEDGDGNLWIGTRHDGIIYYDRKELRFTEYNTQNSDIFPDQNSNIVQSLFMDSRGRLWVGGEKYVARCTVNRGKIGDCRIYRTDVGAVTFAEDGLGRVWAGSSRLGILIFGDVFDKPVNVREGPGWNTTKIIPNGPDKMIFSLYSQGIYEIDIHTLQYRMLNEEERFLSFTAKTLSLYMDAQQNLWIGTYGGGLVVYHSDIQDFRIFSLYSGLPSNDVLAIEEDAEGCLWISTSYGLSRYNPVQENFFNYRDYDGTQGNQFNDKCSFKGSDGTLYFGGNHGLTFFDPSEVPVQRRLVPVVLEDLKVANRSIRPGGPDRILSEAIQATDAVRLTHRQNILSVDYVGIDFNNARNLNYAYMLEGSDREWNYVNNLRRASYSNLPPGHYTFRVKAQSGDGTWNDNHPATLRIEILPSPWKSWWALTLYILLFAAVLLAFIRLYIRNRLHRERLLLSEREKEQEKEVSRMKENFFNNISHELRIPLTLIYGNLALLKSRVDDRQEREQHFNLLDYNIKRLLKLIDQLLDLGRIENDTLLLSLQETDLVPPLRDIISGFYYYAKEKDILLRFEPKYTGLTVPVDFDKIDKIVQNLLSNALKYTPEGGEVELIVELTDRLEADFSSLPPADEYLKITVKDNGIGMTEQEIGQVFERYRRFEGKTAAVNNIGGTGIGLHYVKNLVKNHRGEITARSAPEGGMVFCVVIPLDNRAYEEARLHRREQQAVVLGKTADIPATLPSLPREGIENNDLKTILVVEDDPEVRMFIRQLLREHYTVITAGDGEEGYEKALQEIPDLIVSDVVMPRLSGYELCGKVKDDPTVSHIPVVLLTAKNQSEDYILGYTKGADVYLEKPFDPQLLITIIRNIFENKERQKQTLLAQTDRIEAKKKAGLSPLDQKFMDKLYAYIDKDLSNEQLNVNMLGKELGFSRTSFYRKIKALTGQSPNDFLRIYRLNRAAELIQQEEYTLSEIGEMMGFATYSHFSTTFKKHFGVPPREYQNRS